MRRLLFLLPLVGFFAVAVWGGLALFRDGSARLPPSTLIDQPVPDFALGVALGGALFAGLLYALSRVPWVSNWLVGIAMVVMAGDKRTRARLRLKAKTYSPMEVTPSGINNSVTSSQS